MVEQLGKYEFIKKIDTGGMAEIYLARQKGAEGFEKNIVIKKILPHLAKDSEFIKRLIDEGKIAVNLTHGNIAQIYDLVTEGEEFYLVMEYIDGIDLRELLAKLREKNEKMPISIILFILTEVAKGLSYAHKKTDKNGISLGIVHRDISPSNIMISKEGEVKILDFGIAKAKGKTSYSLPGTIRGKFLYLSPEQAKGEEIDCRSDIFSLGVIAYEMLSCKRPFDGKSDLEILNNVINFTPSFPEEFFPSPLKKIIMKCLEKDPKNRYSSAEDLYDALLLYLYETHTKVSSKEVSKFISSFVSSEEIKNKKSLDEILSAEMSSAKMLDENVKNSKTLSVEIQPPFTPKRSILKKWKFFKIALFFLPLLFFSFLLIYFMGIFPKKESEFGIEIPKNFLFLRNNENKSFAFKRREYISQIKEEKAQDLSKKRVLSEKSTSKPETYPKGVLLFRYFPADCVIEIDGKILSTNGLNLVQTEIDQGKHTLIIKDKSGKEMKRVEFFIEKDKILNLGTIEIGENNG